MKKWLFVAGMVLAGAAWGEDRTCPGKPGMLENAYCESDLVSSLGDELAEVINAANSLPNMPGDIPKSIERWARKAESECKSNECLAQYHRYSISRFKFITLLSQERESMNRVFSGVLRDMLDAAFYESAGPMKTFAQSIANSMPSHQYGKRFGENPIRAYSELSDKPILLYGAIQGIGISAEGVPELELYGAARYDHVRVTLNDSDESLEYATSVSVGESAAIVCTVERPRYGMPEASGCMPYKSFKDMLVEESKNNIMTLDIGFSALFASRLDKKDEAPLGFHGMARVFTSSLYAATHLQECSIGATEECISRVWHALHEGDVDGWVMKEFFFSPS